MHPLNIFIVEDSAMVRETLMATLEEHTPVHWVGHADTAREAIGRLVHASAPCDLAIVDVMLREGTGAEVLGALKRCRSPIRRVVLTNYPTPLIRDHCLALGADRVFDKSGEVEGLLDYCSALAAERGERSHDG